VHVPTHRPCIRVDKPPILFIKRADKISYLIGQIAAGGGIRPVLIGTNSVEESEELMENLRHNWINMYDEMVWDGEERYKSGKLLMLNARPEFIKMESQIIAQAGLPGMVTVATSMAGRGTDILLGGNPKGLVESAIYRGVLSHCIQNSDDPRSLPVADLDLMTQNPPASVKGLMAAALARSKSTEDGILTEEAAEKLMARVMSLAESLRSEVVLKLK